MTSKSNFALQPPFSSAATLKDVAAVARVHHTTVSLALRGSDKIPLSTRDRIKTFAAAIGYRSDPIKSALAARRTRSRLPRITFLTNRPTKTAFNDTRHMRYFYAGAKRQAEAMGFVCDLVLCGDPRVDPKTIEANLRKNRTEGIILGAFVPKFKSIGLDWSQYALVKIDSHYLPLRSTAVSNDQCDAVHVAYHHLHQIGYRRIGIAVGNVDEEGTGQLFGAGYYLAVERDQGKRIPIFYFADHDTMASAADRLKKWIFQHRIDAVLSNWSRPDELLSVAGFRVPEQIGCACLCLNDPNPQLAGIILNHAAVGQKAAEAVSLLLSHDRRGMISEPITTYVPGQWQPGSSVYPSPSGK